MQLMSERSPRAIALSGPCKRRAAMEWVWGFLSGLSPATPQARQGSIRRCGGFRQDDRRRWDWWVVVRSKDRLGREMVREITHPTALRRKWWLKSRTLGLDWWTAMLRTSGPRKFSNQISSRSIAYQWIFRTGGLGRDARICVKEDQSGVWECDT
jgi:hypothetical protein